MRIFPILEIEVSPEIFAFTLKNERLSLKTVVEYEFEKRFIIKSVGEIKPEANGKVVHLFSPAENTVHPVEKLWLLSGFIGYGIGRLTQQKNLVFRPHVIYKGDSKLAIVLCGYQRTLLQVAALEGGARKVEFE